MHNFGDADVSYPTFQIITSDEYLTIGSISQENAYWWGIDENIIVVNKNESANGVSETTAGLRVDRGGQTYEDVQFVYDESFQTFMSLNFDKAFTASTAIIKATIVMEVTLINE